VEEKSKCHLKGILSDMATIVYLQKKNIIFISFHSQKKSLKLRWNHQKSSKNIKNWGVHPHKKKRNT
jgi:hypothetical protein